MGPLQERASILFYSPPDGVQPSLAPKTIIDYTNGASPGTGKPSFYSSPNGIQPNLAIPIKTLYSTRMGPLQERANILFIHLQTEYSPRLAPKNII